jgi:DNA-binding LacI/PurR family transcriptional regulator
VLRGIESVTDAFGYQTMLAHYGYKPEMEENVSNPCSPGTLTA